jgi:uncharacterized lipoprotein YajG
MKIFLMSLLVSLNLLAANKAPAPTAATTEPAKAAGTGKSHNFEDLLVNGKYHFADEAVSTVEADKVFDSLIGVRNDFKDRLEDSATNK